MDRIIGDPEPAVVIEDRLRIPRGTHTFAGFQAWVASGSLPEDSRIDFLAGDVEIEVSTAELHTHGAVQLAVAARLHALFSERDLGEVFAGRARFSSRVAEVSAEPDVVGIFWDSLEEGRVHYAARGRAGGGAGGVGGVVEAAEERGPDRWAEIDGPPDLIVEILSDGSAGKDTERLPRLYALAGVRELWLVDARGSHLRFEIHALHGAAYLLVRPDAHGWSRSEQLGRSCRLTRQPTRGGTWRYLLEDRA